VPVGSSPRIIGNSAIAFMRLGKIDSDAVFPRVVVQDGVAPIGAEAWDVMSPLRCPNESLPQPTVSITGFPWQNGLEGFKLIAETGFRFG